MPPRVPAPLQDRARSWIVAVACALGLGAPLAAQNLAADTAAAAKPPVAPPLIVERGGELLPVYVPRDEELTFYVTLDFGVLGSPKVGEVTLTSSVTPFHAAGLLALEQESAATGEQALISAHAKGEYAVYSADQSISTRILPQAWPRYLHRNVQTGTENRQHELLIGERESATTSQFRADGHCKGCDDRTHFMKPNWVWQDEYHCKKCRRAEHRMWKAPVAKPVPAGTVDMVTAMLLARSLVQQGKSSTSFSLLDKDDLWDVDVSLGRRQTRSVRAGKFEALEVLLVTRPAAGEAAKESDFKGLFGLHGTISIWFHAATGVPVEISGTVPAGPIELDVAIELARYRGTPEGFAPTANE